MANHVLAKPDDFKLGYSPWILGFALVLLFAVEFILTFFLNTLSSHSPLMDATVGAMLFTAVISPLVFLYLRIQSRRRNEVAYLFNGVRAVLSYREFVDSARVIFDSCKTSLGATAGYVALLSSDGKENEVLFLEAGGRECTVDPSLPMPIRGLRAESYLTGKAVYDNDFNNSKWVGFMPMGHVILDNVLFAPLVVEGKAVGLLGVANKPGGFTDDDARFAEAYGEMAAIALVNSRTMELLETSEARFRSLIQSANQAIISVNSAGAITFWNRKAEELLEYAADEIIGRPLTTIIPERFRQAHQEGLSRILAGSKPLNIGKIIEMYAVAKGGKEFPIELSISSWKTKTEIFFTGILHDISDRKRAETELLESNRMLEKRVEERTAELVLTNKELDERVKRRTASLEASNKELEAFTYSISHDLRAPLRGIDGFSLALLEDCKDKLDDQEKGHLRRIRGGVEKITGLMDDMLKLSRITLDEMHMEEVDLAQVAKSIADELKAREPERKVEFNIMKARAVVGDRRLLSLALENLLGNAWKFTGKTQGAKIEFGETEVGGETAFFVRDNGVGFNPEFLEKLFLPFQRLHTEAEFEGTGIGLNIVKRIITRHGGRIWAEAKIGGGATFYFVI